VGGGDDARVNPRCFRSFRSRESRVAVALRRYAASSSGRNNSRVYGVNARRDDAAAAY